MTASGFYATRSGRGLSRDRGGGSHGGGLHRTFWLSVATRRPVRSTTQFPLPVASESPGFQLLSMLSALKSGDPIQHVPNASRQILQGYRLLNELNVEVDAAMMHDRVARIAGHEQHLQSPGRSSRARPESSRPFIPGMMTSVSIRSIFADGCSRIPSAASAFAAPIAR